MLDPDVSIVLRAMSVDGPLDVPEVAKARAAAIETPLRYGGVAEPTGSVRETTVFGPGGLIPVRVYRPDVEVPVPLCVYAHGGGWVTGSLESHDKLCRRLANRLEAVVVAVDYRLAPEHDFPAALDDVEAIWHWCRERANVAGVDRLHYLVAGDSSGGNLAAALTLRLKRHNERQPALQLLLYPALDARCALPSYGQYSDGYNLSAAHMRWYWDRYAGAAPREDPELSPLTAPDLSGLAPALIAVAEYDVLRDDGVEYVRRLEGAGGRAELLQCDGMVHGFLRWTGAVPAAERWLTEIAARARRLLSASSAGAVSGRSAWSRP